LDLNSTKRKKKGEDQNTIVDTKWGRGFHRGAYPESLSEIEKPSKKGEDVRERPSEEVSGRRVETSQDKCNIIQGKCRDRGRENCYRGGRGL